ncbi:MAG: DUF898 family protein [Clostridia bacterium]|nr:DUF898 family protein [Clostridia bacterium]
MKCSHCGKKLDKKAAYCSACGEPVEKPVPKYESTFTGGAFKNAFIALVAWLAVAVSFGIVYPAMKCWHMRWQTKHTYINGRRLYFDGHAMQLFGRYLLWLFLSVITLGIYYVVAMQLKLVEWKTKHTHYLCDKDDLGYRSRFDGRWYQLFGVNFVAVLVTVITLGIGYFWAHCYRQRWYCKHTKIDGDRLYFDGKAMQYFGTLIKWILLTIVTIGIYLFWLTVKSHKWTISHTIAEE